MLLLVAAVTGATANPDVRDGCRERCGDVIVPYPFGIGEQRCAMNANFFLDCTSNDALRLEERILARNISLLNGTLTVRIPIPLFSYDVSGSPQIMALNNSIKLGPAYTFSDSRNVFTAVGCDIISMVINEEETSGVGCLSLCSGNVTMSKENPCLGSGCCQSSIPKGLKSLNITVQNLRDHKDVSEHKPPGFACLEDKDSLDLSGWPLSRTPNDNFPDRSNVVIEWVAQNETCEEAQANKSSYDECKDPETYTCHGKCHNTFGDYECKCPLGMSGDGKRGCSGFGIITIIIC